MKLKVHVYRFTGKRLFPHLLRTIFTSSHLSAGVDINSVAYGLGDTPAVVLGAYNELQAGKHGPEPAGVKPPCPEWQRNATLTAIVSIVEPLIPEWSSLSRL